MRPPSGPALRTLGLGPLLLSCTLVVAARQDQDHRSETSASDPTRLPESVTTALADARPGSRRDAVAESLGGAHPFLPVLITLT